MESKKFIFICGVILLTFGCTTGNCRSQKIKQEQAEGPTPVKENKLIPPPSVSERVKVYKLDGSLQCAQGKRVELKDMQNDLKDIKVYKSFSENDGMMRIQMCGAPTGNANVYEIDRENLKAALALGFKEWLKN
jgi:hypothetical protein